MAEIDWKQTNVQISNLVRAITRPFAGAWTLVSGHKLSVWKVRVLPVDEELAVAGAIPGEVLAVTGKGIWVQCGQGQVQILDSTLESAPDKPAAEVLPASGARSACCSDKADRTLSFRLQKFNPGKFLKTVQRKLLEGGGQCQK